MAPTTARPRPRLALWGGGGEPPPIFGPARRRGSEGGVPARRRADWTSIAGVVWASAAFGGRPGVTWGRLAEGSLRWT